MTSTLLAQFLSESRDLLERASGGFLALEKAPDDAEALDELFRSVHTMKGASGLFDIGPFTAVVHAAEDVLDRVRDGRAALTPAMTDLFLEGLDQLARWLDDLEAREALDEGAAETGRRLADRLRALIPGEGAEAAPPPVAEAAAAPGWVAAAVEAAGPSLRAEAAAGASLVALDYAPHEQAFYSGDDPLFTVLGLPGRRWLSVEPVAPWPSPDGLDPYQCRLRFRAILAADPDDLRGRLRYVADQARLTPLGPADLADGAGAGRDPATVEAALELLATQRAMLGTAADPACWAGRAEAAGAALARVRGALDLPAAFDAAIAAAVADALATRSAARLADMADALRAALGPAAGAAAGPTAAPAAAAPADAPPRGSEEGGRRAAAIKVDQARIDALMSLAGELIVAKNSLPFLARRAEDVYGARGMAREIKAQYEVINRIADDLQTAVMQVRMVPVSHVFQRFTRLVRDLSRRLDKQIRLEIEGEETEADKTVVEELADPLVHLLRNAIDHGLETPAERRAAGKPDEGVLRLAARQADDRIVIEVADDGRGVDVGKVRRKAVERGIIDEAACAALDEREALQLVMRAGVSTADAVSDLSGRGVGMDVVATMVRRTSGALSLDSAPGRGTRVSISLPVSMSVHRVMIVETAGEAFGVPIESVIESVRVPASAVFRQKAQETVVLRDRLIPIRRLDRMLGVGARRAATGPARARDGELSLLVVAVEGEQLGLAVDEFRAGVDVVIKPLAGVLAGVREYAGAALLGDGSVLLVLNLRELVQCRWN